LATRASAARSHAESTALDSRQAGRGLLLWAYDSQAYPDVPYDPAGARALLASAGWLQGPDGIRRRNGRRLDIPAGTAVRFEPGQTRAVSLVPLAGRREVYGFRQQVMAKSSCAVQPIA